jgi:hypothetical protein
MTNTSDKLNSALSLLHGDSTLLDGMAAWDTPRRLAFVQTLQDRGNVHAALAMMEVEILLDIAEGRHFISQKHREEISSKTAKSHFRIDNWESLLGYGTYQYGNRNDNTYCGRSRDELKQIAEESAKAIAKNLPKLADAVRVIDVATADKIDEARALRTELDGHEATLKDLTAPLVLTEYAKQHPKATVTDFVQLVEGRANAAKTLVETMNKLGQKGRELQQLIDKALYEGLPGLSEAVVELAVEKIKSVSAMPQMMRRVSETVQFGDSAQATTMLSTFEKDELKLDGSIKEKFKEAMDKLRNAAKGLAAPAKTPKALPKKRSAKSS